MKKVVALRGRQIHLDFHTGPAVHDVGRDFDAREFARTMKKAHVDSVTVFAKCHHGHLYYNTKRPERHPGLRPGLDLLGEQIEALHSEGIRAPIYISVMCDEFAANTHPEWICLTAEGKRVGREPVSNANFNWQILDMASPYQDYLAEQTQEILKTFRPVDGIFFDMCWDQPSASNFAKTEMLKHNLDPTKEEDRNRHSHELALRYMKRFGEMVRKSSANASIFFNGRTIGNLREEFSLQTQSEIEALPTGGWGYMFFPKNVRFARLFPLPYMSMTARFHKSWADFGGIKPQAALEYETSQSVAHGASCSIGDQLHPRGTLDRAAYELIGRVYGRIEAREPWLTGAKSVAQIAVLQVEPPQVGGVPKRQAQPAEEGAVRMLTQLKHQFDLIDRQTRFENYELLILPDAVTIDPPLAKKIRAFVKSGGALLAAGRSGVSAEGNKTLLSELGIRAHGLSPFATTYIRFGSEIAVDVPPTDHVMYERGVRVTAEKGATVLARVVEPYFDRTWEHFSSHAQTPSDKVSKFAAAVQKGRAAYIAFPIFSAFALHGNFPYRLLVRNVIERLLPEPLLRVAGPTSTETSVAEQGDRTIVHLLQYAAERRTEKLDLIEDVVPLYDVPLSLRMKKAPSSVYLAPEETPIEFEHLHGRVNLRVPQVRGHAMVVFENGKL